MDLNKIDIDNLKEESLDTVSGLERRNFLKMGLMITGVFAGGKILSVVSKVDEVFASTINFAEKYPYKPHYSMVIREGLCIDCQRCMVACHKTNDVPAYGWRTRILEKITPDAIGRKRGFMPILCNQCNDPACVRACPTRASYKDQHNGIVRIDSKKCIGCKACMLACPYDARYFNEEKHAVDKCDFCYESRLSKGKKLTACAAVCPTGARIFGDISDPNNVVYKMVHQIEREVWVLRPAVGTKPNVFYMKATNPSPWALRRQPDVR